MIMLVPYLIVTSRYILNLLQIDNESFEFDQKDRQKKGFMKSAD